MIGQQVNVDLREIVISNFRFPWFGGKVAGEFRKYADGHRQFFTSKMLAEEARLVAEEARLEAERIARETRTAEDAALGYASNKEGYTKGIAQTLTAAEAIIPGFNTTVNAAAKKAVTKVRNGKKLVKKGTEMVEEGETDLTYAQMLGSRVTLNPPSQPVR